MPLSYQNYTGDNVTTTFNIPFTYTATSEISVTVDGVAQTGLTFPSSSQVQLTSAPASSTVVQVRRTTDLTSRAVDFASGSVLTEEDLDNANIQIFHSSQEAVDLTDDTIQEDIDSKWDAESKVIKNVANPTNAQDAATKDYLENTWLTPADKAQLNSLNTTNLNTVATNISDVNDVAADEADIGIVATSITDVNTLAPVVTDIATLADITDGTVATNAIQTVADIQGNVTTVAGIENDVTTVAGQTTNLQNVTDNLTAIQNASTNATNAAQSATDAQTAQGLAEDAQAAAEAALDNFDDRFLGAKATDPVLDNDGNALLDGALYFDTTNDIMKVYDLTNTTWRQLTLTSANQANVNTVAGQISPTNNIAIVAGDSADIGTVAGLSTDIQALADIEDGTTATNAISNVGGSIANVNTVASNLASVNNFGEVYRIASSAPTTSLDIGDLYFDTTANELKVYKSSGWAAAGSTVNGTSARFHYDISGTPTSVTGADANGSTLAYDAGYVDVYVNGVRMSDADITITSGDTVTFTEALADGDEVDIVAYGTFSVASLNADNLDSGTVPDARITGAYTGITNLTMSGDLTVDTNTLYVDSANNRVGVGTVSPTYQLDVTSSGGSSFAMWHNSTTGSGASNGFLVGASGNDAIIWNYEAATMQFSTNNTERMRIDSSGILLVGATSSNSANVGHGLNPNGFTYHTRDGGEVLRLNRKTSDGDIAVFHKDGSTVGSIGHWYRLYIGEGDTGIRFRDDTNAIVPMDVAGLANRDASIDLGSSGVRFNHLYLSGGVYLGGTGSANKLDDYEEGSGTLTITGTSGGTATTSGSADYQYTKIGNLVSFQFEFNCSSVSGVSGTLQIALPFTPSEYSVGALRCYLVTFDGSPIVETTTSVSELRLRTSKTGSATQDILSTGYYIGEITYKTTA
jgi:hypothetical protein